MIGSGRVNERDDGGERNKRKGGEHQECYIRP